MQEPIEINRQAFVKVYCEYECAHRSLSFSAPVGQSDVIEICCFRFSLPSLDQSSNVAVHACAG